MIHLRDFKTGAPERERRTLCGRPCLDVPTTRGCLAWWRARAQLCPNCWDAWCGTLEVIVSLPAQKEAP